MIDDRKDKNSDFVLEKSIFSNVFEKDIRRVYVYKKAERLSKALYLIRPAFRNHRALKDKIDSIVLALLTGSTLPRMEAKEVLSRELLALLGLLSVSKTGGILSLINVDFIETEVKNLLEEVAMYEDQKIALPAIPTLATLMKRTQHDSTHRPGLEGINREGEGAYQIKDIENYKRQNKDKGQRADSILSLIRSKGPLYIKDISSVIPEVSEKTIQRELQLLVLSGKVQKTGDRRWTRYSVATSGE